VSSIGAGAQSQLDPRLQKTFDYAIEVTKQLLTLGSAILALTLTVAKEAPNGRRGFMLAGWFAFLLSVIFGIVSLYTLMREFAPRGDGRNDPLRSDRGACGAPCSYRSSPLRLAPSSSSPTHTACGSASEISPVAEGCQ